MIGKNNPFNIRTGSKWKGLCGSTKGFCDFEFWYHGVRVAMYLLMRTYRRKGLDNIEQIVSRFAPPTENNTTAYVDYVSSFTRIPRDFSLITKEQYFLVLQAMSRFEGNPVSLEHIRQVYIIFKKEFDYEKD